MGNAFIDFLHNDIKEEGNYVRKKVGAIGNVHMPAAANKKSIEAFVKKGLIDSNGILKNTHESINRMRDAKAIPGMPDVIEEDARRNIVRRKNMMKSGAIYRAGKSLEVKQDVALNNNRFEREKRTLEGIFADMRVNWEKGS